MRVIVAGSRDFADRKLLFDTLDKAFGAVLSKITVLSGRARGADRLGEEWANERGVKLELFPADWDTHGKSAGIVRNHEMEM